MLKYYADGCEQIKLINVQTNTLKASKISFRNYISPTQKDVLIPSYSQIVHSKDSKICTRVHQQTVKNMLKNACNQFESGGRGGRACAQVADS